MVNNMHTVRKAVAAARSIKVDGQRFKVIGTRDGKPVLELARSRKSQTFMTIQAEVR